MTILNIAQMGWVPHPVLMLMEAVVISAVLGLTARGPASARLCYGVYLLGCFGGAVFAAGWLMHLIHG